MKRWYRTWRLKHRLTRPPSYRNPLCRVCMDTPRITRGMIGRLFQCQNNWTFWSVTHSLTVHRVQTHVGPYHCACVASCRNAVWRHSSHRLVDLHREVREHRDGRPTYFKQAQAALPRAGGVRAGRSRVRGRRTPFTPRLFS
jgi:hypothetical protein